MENIDLYYQSLKEVVDELEAWMPSPPRAIQRVVDWILGSSVVLFILCFLPVIPALLMLLRAYLPINIWIIDSSDASFASFALLWIALVVVSAVFMLPMIWINDKVDSSNPGGGVPNQTLSSDQLAFVKVYEACKELKVYFVSHIDKHVGNAYQCLRSQLEPERLHDPLELRLDFPNAIPEISPFPADADEDAVFSHKVRAYPPYYRWAAFGSLAIQVSSALDLLHTFNEYKWFRIDAETKSVLQGLISLRSKLLFGVDPVSWTPVSLLMKGVHDATNTTTIP